MHPAMTRRKALITVFGSDYDIVSDTGKARRFGFHECVDTEQMFLRLFAEFRRSRVIP